MKNFSIAGRNMKYCQCCDKTFKDSYVFCNTCGEKLCDYDDVVEQEPDTPEFKKRIVLIYVSVIAILFGIVIRGLLFLVTCGVISEITEKENTNVSASAEANTNSASSTAPASAPASAPESAPESAPAPDYTRDENELLRYLRSNASIGESRVESADEIFKRAEVAFNAGNYLEALDLYRRAQKEGNSKAGAALSKVISEIYKRAQNEFDAKNYQKALNFYLAIADKHADAMNQIGWCYQKGLGVEKDLKRARDYYRKAAEAGSIFGMYNYGCCYLDGDGGEKNYTEAVKWFRKSADGKNAYAMVNLGWCYQNGLGVDKDLKAAREYYRKAAEAGSIFGMYSYGWCYMNEVGGEKNYAEAVKWFRKSAAGKNANAMFNLGWCYENGYGVDKNLPEAARWYREAQKNGVAEAEAALRRVLVPAAVSSASADSPDAIFKQAMTLYNKGDFREAVSLFEKAAEKNHVTAIFYLEDCYREGKGVSKDLVKAENYRCRANAITQGGIR